MLKSMRIGDEAEIEVMQFMENLGCAVTKNNDKNTRIEYDILAEFVIYRHVDEYGGYEETAIVKFEVKNDVMASKTGNVALEYFNSKSKKASGITATKADWWVHKIDGELWIIRVADLLNFTKSEKPRKIINGGGDNNADLLIYEIERFTSKCKLLSEMKLGDLL